MSAYSLPARASSASSAPNPPPECSTAKLETGESPHTALTESPGSNCQYLRLRVCLGSRLDFAKLRGTTGGDHPRREQPCCEQTAKPLQPFSANRQARGALQESKDISPCSLGLMAAPSVSAQKPAAGTVISMSSVACGTKKENKKTSISRLCHQYVVRSTTIEYIECRAQRRQPVLGLKGKPEIIAHAHGQTANCLQSCFLFLVFRGFF